MVFLVFLVFVVFLVFLELMIMTSIQQQIIEQKQNKTEKLKDLFYVDYCNNCKDAEIRGEYGRDYVPCHHPWYCWQDGGEVQELEYQLSLLRENEHWQGYLTAQEYEKLKKLKARKWELIKEGRRNMPKVKHGKVRV